MKLNQLLLALTLVCAITAKIFNEEDYIESFPEWPAGYDFDVYSGYLTTQDASGLPLHYMFLTKQSDSAPENAPTVLWLQGGDGCSSLQGMVSEIGPYLMQYPRQRFLTTPNEYAWNTLANVLFIEAPVGVGFSNNGNDDKGTYEIGDDTTADNLYYVLKQFFNTKFPDFRSSDFFIAGEGQAGQFIALTAEQIFNGNAGKSVGDSDYINLKSLLLGNPVLQENGSTEFWQHYHSLEVLDYHGLYGPQMDELWYKCVSDQLTNPGCEYFAEKSEYIKIQLNPFNVNAKCQRKVSDDDGNPEDISESAYCLDWKYVEKFFNDNKDKLNVSPTFPEQYKWQVCSMYDEMMYKPHEGGVVKLLGKLVKDHGLNLVLYSGLNDSTTPYMTTHQDFKDIIRETKGEMITELRSYLMNKQIAGWVTVYENVQYATVRAAGHQVPADQPAAAWYILSQTIKGEPLA